MEIEESDCDPMYFNFFKQINDSDVLCVVCKTREKTEDGIHWEIYGLACGCVAHTRCQRKLVNDKGCLFCAGCNRDLVVSLKTRHCGRCDGFGHMSKQCHLPKPVYNYNYKTTLQTCSTCSRCWSVIITGAEYYNCHVCGSRMKSTLGEDWETMQ